MKMTWHHVMYLCYETSIEINMTAKQKLHGQLTFFSNAKESKTASGVFYLTNNNVSMIIIFNTLQFGAPIKGLSIHATQKHSWSYGNYTIVYAYLLSCYYRAYQPQPGSE